MKNIFLISIVFFIISCNQNNKEMEISQKAIFLHHSTGKEIWKGGANKYVYKLFKNSYFKKWLKNYNEKNGTKFIIEEQIFPKKEPYGWNNYPFDYYNIWVKNGGNQLYKEEPTLELLTKKYELIIWKHCYPVGNISADTSKPDINSGEKRIENYKLQYNALKRKMHQFPDTKFLIWTGAAFVKNNTIEEKAKRMKEFVNWVVNEWDENGDNIYIWDFYNLETDGGIYLKDEYALNDNNSHPNSEFSKKVMPLFGERVVEVLMKK